MPGDGFDPADFVPETGKRSKIKAVSPYNCAQKIGNASVYWSDFFPEFKIMVRLDGHSLAEMRKGGASDSLLYEWIERMNGNVTRIDLAIDLFDCEAYPVDILHAWECDQFMTTAQSVTLIEKKRRKKSAGSTVYIGSRDSERFVRAYDKGKEQKTDLDWIRVELEMKGKRAMQSYELAHKEGTDGATLGMLRDVVEWSDVDWFEDIFAGRDDLIDISSIGRPETNHERWLRTVCIPAVAEAAKHGLYGVEHQLRAILADIDENGVHGAL